MKTSNLGKFKRDSSFWNHDRQTGDNKNSGKILQQLSTAEYEQLKETEHFLV